MRSPINKQESDRTGGDHPVSKLVGEKIFWLSLVAPITDEQIIHIASAVFDFYKGKI